MDIADRNSAENGLFRMIYPDHPQLVSSWKTLSLLPLAHSFKDDESSSQEDETEDLFIPSEVDEPRILSENEDMDAVMRLPPPQVEQGDRISESYFKWRNLYYL